MNSAQWRFNPARGGGWAQLRGGVRTWLLSCHRALPLQIISVFPQCQILTWMSRMFVYRNNPRPEADTEVASLLPPSTQSRSTYITRWFLASVGYTPCLGNRVACSISTTWLSVWWPWPESDWEMSLTQSEVILTKDVGLVPLVQDYIKFSPKHETCSLFQRTRRNSPLEFSSLHFTVTYVCLVEQTPTLQCLTPAVQDSWVLS